MPFGLPSQNQSSRHRLDLHAPNPPALGRLGRFASKSGPASPRGFSLPSANRRLATMARRLIVPTDTPRAPAAGKPAGVSLARTFRELTARCLHRGNFALLRARYVLAQRSSPWDCPLSARRWPWTDKCLEPAAERQAIFLGATEPRAARPGKVPTAGIGSRAIRSRAVNGTLLHRETTYLLSRHRAP